MARILCRTVEWRRFRHPPGGSMTAKRFLKARPFVLLLLALAALPVIAEREPFAPEGTPPRYMPARQYDLQHLKLDLAFDWDAKSVAGTATHTLTPLLPGLDSL